MSPDLSISRLPWSGRQQSGPEKTIEAPFRHTNQPPPAATDAAAGERIPEQRRDSTPRNPGGATTPRQGSLSCGGVVVVVLGMEVMAAVVKKELIFHVKKNLFS